MILDNDSVNMDHITDDDINELEERRIEGLKEANIDEEEVIQKAKKNVNSWIGYSTENINTGKADLEFAMHQQWSSAELSEFQRLRKVAQTFNKIYDPVRKIISEQRKNKPDLIVRSLTGHATQEQIDLRTDLVRSIAYASQTDLVYQTAFKNALLTGMGAFQVGIEYESPRSFNKVIKYNIVPDATRCSWDPCAVLPHKGDGNFSGRNFTMSRAEFFATYPWVHNPVSFADPYMLLDFQFNTKDHICINEQAMKEWFPVNILFLSNGHVLTEEEWEDAQKIHHEQQKIVEGSFVSSIIKNGIPTVIARRTTNDYRIRVYRLMRDQILEWHDWPSSQLPHIYVDGDSYYKEGKQYTKSFVHDAIDAQRSLNYFNSEITNEIKNRRREQWLGTPDNILGNEQIWRNPEVQIGILTAKPDSKTGMMPIKQQPWDVSPAIMGNAQRATQDLKEILGFSEQEVINSRDMSGVARRERKLEGGLAAYTFMDNLNQSIAQGGRIVNDLLPFIVGSQERFMNLKKPDGSTATVILNHLQKDGSLKNALDDGQYEVEIDAGPSFAVQKEIALEFLQQLLSICPQAVPLVIDLYAKNLDVQFMPQIVERLKTMVPPNIIAQEEGKPMPPPPPNPQQQMAQQEMQLKMADMRNKQAQIAMEGQQHQLDKLKLHNDMVEMIHRMKGDHAKDDLDKEKIQVQMMQLLADINNKNADRDVDVHKIERDHTVDLASLLTK